MSTGRPYLPFDSLLLRLRQQGFTMGPDVYIRVQELLNAYAAEPGEQHQIRLRYQLGAILSRTEAELRLFYEIFDEYVAEYEAWAESLKPEEEGEEEDVVSSSSFRLRRLLLPLLLSLTPLAVVGWFALRPLPCPEGNVLFQSSLTNSNEQQTLAFQNRSIIRQSTRWTLKPVPRIDSLLWNFGDGALATGNETVHRYESPGSYFPELTIFLSNGCVLHKRENEPLLVREDIFLRPNFSMESSNGGWQFVDNSYFRSPINELVRLWEFGDGSSSEEPSPFHTFPVGRDSFQIRLTLIGQWGNRRDTVSIQKPLSTLPRPTLARRDQDFLDEDISDLLRTQSPQLLALLCGAQFAARLSDPGSHPGLAAQSRPGRSSGPSSPLSSALASGASWSGSFSNQSFL